MLRATKVECLLPLILRTVLGGSWVFIRGVLSPRIWVISIVTLRITLLMPTREPPSRAAREDPFG